MMWSDIAMIVFSATCANHMGLVEAVEGVIKHKIPIVNCSRCLTFWSTLAYTLLSGWSVIPSVAVSFAAAYVAMWLELGLGLIDILYNKTYESAYTAKAADTEDTQDEVS